MKFNDNNILLNEWKARYEQQNESTKRKLDELKSDLVQGRNNNFQLLKIKRSYKYPEKGDIFVFQPRKNIFFYGLVLNAHVNNLQGEDMYVVALFRSKSKSVDELSFKLDYSELLLAPLMVDRFYWNIENKLGIHGSPTCELVYKNAKAELCGDRKLGLIKYVMALMNGARLGIAAQSVGLSQAAYNEGLAYAKDRKQFGKAIIDFPAVYDMLAIMKAKLDAGRALLYQTARYVDIYKALDDIARERKLTPEERKEQKQYAKLADSFTPLAKGMNSEYANQNAYDCIQIHGGSGFMMEYACQRIYRDARITSIYEGTTQLQTVAAIRYVTNGSYLATIREFEAIPCSAEMEPLKARLVEMANKFEASMAKVKESQDQELLDFVARRLMEMAADIIMAHLLIQDATKAPELFAKSAVVYTNYVEAEIEKHQGYIGRFNPEELISYRQR